MTAAAEIWKQVAAGSDGSLETPLHRGIELDEADDGTYPADMVRQRFPRLKLTELLAADRPPRQWILHGLIPRGTSCSLVAPAGAGKSLLLLALAVNIARGRREFAGLAIPRRRRVLLVDMENTVDDLADRFASLGVTPADEDDLDALIPIHLPPLAPLDTAHGGAELAAIIDAYHVGPDDVVILDSFQRVTDGPENDSDTYRDYYRHTGIMLKRRGVTAIRTDNTGKDTERGARGSSGKRDDVDLELLLTRDGQHPDRFYIRPGKARLSDIVSITLQSATDDDGKLTYSSAGDPWRARVTDAHAALDSAGVPIDAGERAAADLIKKAGFKVARQVLRAAVRERKDMPVSSVLGAPRTDGAPSGAPTETHRADEQRRTAGAPDGNTAETLQPRGKPCADEQRRTDGAPDAPVHQPTAPPFPPSKERRAGAHHPEQGQFEEANDALVTRSNDVPPGAADPPREPEQPLPVCELHPDGLHDRDGTCRTCTLLAEADAAALHADPAEARPEQDELLWKLYDK